MTPRIDQLLVRENLISLQQLQTAREEQKKTGKRLGHTLTALGFIQEGDLISFLSRQYGVPSIQLGDFEIEPDVLKLVPQDAAEKHVFIPVAGSGAHLIIAMADPSNIFAM